MLEDLGKSPFQSGDVHLIFVQLSVSPLIFSSTGSSFTVRNALVLLCYIHTDKRFFISMLINYLRVNTTIFCTGLRISGFLTTQIF